MGTALSNLHQQIKDFNNYLPSWVYHRNKKNIKPIASPKDEAIKDLYIAPFHSQWRKYIAIDIDHENWYEATHDNDLIPNIVIKNKNNNKAHLLYETDPVWLGKGSSDRLKGFHRRINKGMNLALGGDTAFNNQTIKNPNNENWETIILHDVAKDLRELSECVDLPPIYLGAEEEELYEGRNHEIFTRVRKQSYRIKQNYNNFLSFTFAISEIAHSINNNFPIKLGSKEVDDMIKRISEWTWNIYEFGGGRDIDYGRDADVLSGITDLKEKQRISAIRTRKLIHKRHKDKITSSVDTLIMCGENPTPNKIIEHSEVSRSVVYREYKEIQVNAINKAQNKSLEDLRKINYAEFKKEEWLQEQWFKEFMRSDLDVV
jgi:hypothetical protein